MKSSRFGILALALSLAATAYCSEGVDDVIKLQKSGVEAEVIQAFVQDSAVAYELSADDIQKLEDANVSATLIVSMIDHGKSLRNNPVEAGTIDTPAPADADPLVLAGSQPVSEDVAVAPPDGQANISTFYESLAPYGTWSQDENASWVWEPNDGARDHNWRPYANNGHWTWTDHGWYFESDSPYGWATFHYGRWGYNKAHRWSWAPDNVWGPAWVDWRQSDDHIGWAPLPFGSHFEADAGFSFHGKNVGFDFHGDLGESDYCFVDSNRFLDVNIGIVLVPEDRRHEVYGRTKIVNNTYVYNDNRIINKGISTTIVERATKRKIEEVKIEDARIAAGQPIKGERRNANTIVAYRPKVSNVSPVLPPAIAQRQKAAATHTTADRKPVNTAAPKLNEQDARARLATEKAQRKNATSAVKNAAAAGEEEKQKVRSDAAAERKANVETERESKARLNEAKAEAKTKENSAATEQRNARTEAAANAEEKQKIRSEAAAEKKATVETEKESKAKLNEAKAEAKTKENSAATEQRNAKNEAAAEKKAAAAEENATQREVRKEAAQEKTREAKDSPPAKAAEERKAANKEAATEKKAEAEAQREERTESKAEKTKEAKDNK